MFLWMHKHLHLWWILMILKVKETKRSKLLCETLKFPFWISSIVCFGNHFYKKFDLEDNDWLLVTNNFFIRSFDAANCTHLECSIYNIHNIYDCLDQWLLTDEYYLWLGTWFLASTMAIGSFASLTGKLQFLVCPHST